MKKKFYAYFLEKESKSGICETWDECKAIVHGKKARYKSFPSLEEAKDWLAQGAKYEKKLSEELFKTKVDKAEDEIMFYIISDKFNSNARFDRLATARILFDLLKKERI